LSLWEQDPAECDEPPARPFAGRVAGPYDRGFWPAFEVEFYLGAHRLNWCWEGRARGPLFVNLHLLLARKGPMLPATVDIGFDSGGYTEIVDCRAWSPRTTGGTGTATRRPGSTSPASSG
jgi:hypothetical protein